MLDLFIQDVQRWVVPGQIANREQVRSSLILKLLFRHMQVRMMLLIRFGGWCSQKRIRGIPSLIQRILSLLYGIEIAVGQEIGGGLYIAHPYGMVVMADRIGKNCSLIHNITIGMRNKYEFPTLEDEVFIGAGARVLGGICIGQGSKIGANSVVINDIPAGSTVVGIPGKVIGASENLSSVDSQNLVVI